MSVTVKVDVYLYFPGEPSRWRVCQPCWFTTTLDSLLPVAAQGTLGLGAGPKNGGGGLSHETSRPRDTHSLKNKNLLVSSIRHWSFTPKPSFDSIHNLLQHESHRKRKYCYMWSSKDTDW